MTQRHRKFHRDSTTKPTGTFVSLKAGSRAMLWESLKCELPALELAEVASPVVRLARPHCLELYVPGKRGCLEYLPDLELTVEASLFTRLMSKEPFAQALLRWRPNQRRAARPRKIVVEIRDDADPKNEDRKYQTKLRLVEEEYRKIGIGFLTVVRKRDLACVDLEFVHRFALDRHTSVSPTDIDQCTRFLGSPRGTGTIGELTNVLGGGPLGRAKAAALHVRRVISMDISRGLRPNAAVSLLQRTASPDSPISA